MLISKRKHKQRQLELVNSYNKKLLSRLKDISKHDARITITDTHITVEKFYNFRYMQEIVDYPEEYRSMVNVLILIERCIRKLDKEYGGK